MTYKLYFTYKGVEYRVKFACCQGCEELTIGACGWYCGLAGVGCDYPEETIENLKKIEEQVQAMNDANDAAFGDCIHHLY